MTAGALATTILTFAAIVGVGALVRAFGLLKPADAKPLNTVIIYVGLPAFIFQAVHRAQLGPDLWRVVLVSWGVFAVTLTLAWLVTRVRGMAPARAGGFMLASAFGNTGFLGYPVTAALFGAGVVPVAVFSDVFGTVFAIMLVGLPLAARLGGKGHKVNVVREIATFPAVIALLVGLAMRSVALPAAVTSGLDLLASLVAPLIMISVGLSLRPRAMAAGLLDLGLVGALKLAVAPALALAVGSVLLSGVPLTVAALQAGMPSMMLTLVVGERYGLDSDFIASAIFLTTVLSALTIPLVMLAAG